MFGGGKTTDKVVTTITEWFWKIEWDYELFAFVGNDPEDKVILQGEDLGKAFSLCFICFFVCLFFFFFFFWKAVVPSMRK